MHRSRRCIVCARCRCTWGSYVNRPYLEDLGIGAADFPLLCLASSWATATADADEAAAEKQAAGAEAAEATAEPAEAAAAAGAAAGAEAGTTAPSEAAAAATSGGERRGVDEGGEHTSADPAALRMLSERLGTARLGPSARRELGRTCKRILDTGRLRYLEAKGYRGQLRAYVPPEVSPENVLLLAWPEAQ